MKVNAAAADELKKCDTTKSKNVFAEQRYNWFLNSLIQSSTYATK